MATVTIIRPKRKTAAQVRADIKRMDARFWRLVAKHGWEEAHRRV